MRSCLFLILAVVVASCGKESAVAPTPTQAQTTLPPATPTSYTITGTVTDPNRTPILGAVVSVADPVPNPNAQKTATTDFAGRYSLGGLAFSGFSLAVSSPGFISTSRGISLPANAPTTTVDFVLSPIPGISFDGLRTDGAPFRTYTEGSFTVSATVGDWQVLTTYGRPAPFIEFFTPFGPTTSAEISVTANGSAFKFSSVDLYSSVTPIPYEISGSLKGSLVFRLIGTQGNTFGNFATVSNRTPETAVDTLYVRLSNAVERNPIGIDNIRVAF